MNNSFNPFEFVEFVQAQWRVAAGIVIGAVLVALAVSLIMPKKYTATASIIIEPPGGGDPRVSTAVSPVYLESLKTYEQFASSDSLFAQACSKFRLLTGDGAPAVETFKRRVLEVRKPKETKLLQIAVTLRDPKMAQALVQYLAERAVDLSNTVARDGEATELQKARARVEEVRSELAKTEQDLAATSAAGQHTSLEAELVSLAKIQAQITADITDASAQIAELSARDAVGPSPDSDANFLREQLRAQRARATAFETSRAELGHEIAVKSALLSGIDAKREAILSRRRLLQSDLEATSKRLTEVESAAGMRAEQLRIIDPGIVPQRPSSPNLPLNCAAAAALGAVAAVVYFAMSFGLEMQRARYVRGSFKVAQRDSA